MKLEEQINKAFKLMLKKLPNLILFNFGHRLNSPKQRNFSAIDVSLAPKIILTLLRLSYLLRELII